MTTGTKTQQPDAARRACLAAAMGLMAMGPSASRAQAPTPAFDLGALMAVLAERKGGEARFTEERTVGSLDYPLQARGRLTFQAPDRFARFTEEPTTESMEVQGNQVLLKRGKRTRQMTLDAVPEVAALAEAMRGTLSGDASALQRHFRAQVSGNAARWILRLTPLDSRLARTVQQLEISGLGPDVRSLDLRLVGGDRSLMLVEPMPEVPTSNPAPSVGK
ncbi:MAG: outer membrane lipoprotein carrier protein LolA [Inhella sp.]|uniref:LolA-related protein n=2 Tax=Inhella sp. TaxID=1921806 RepID=UPI0022CC3FBB|nr:LolA-related protein [Inhella sp.]MCZ8234390.1 outer membrane lipoprotein carrier protein LolA [Inhella sp.]